MKNSVLMGGLDDRVNFDNFWLSENIDFRTQVSEERP